MRSLIFTLAFFEVTVKASWALPNSSCLQQNVNAEALGRLEREIQAGTYGHIDEMVLLRNGFVVYQKVYDWPSSTKRVGASGPYNYSDPEWYPWRGEGLHTLQSVTKSVTSVLVGIALRKGLLPSLNVPVTAYLGEEPDCKLDPKLTVEDLLCMRSGIQWNEDGPYEAAQNDWSGMERSPDWIRYVLRKPLDSSRPPKFYYSSGVTMLLAQVLEKATGQRLSAFADENLFQPLGIEHYVWKESPTGLADAQGGLYLTARDLASIGQLYLQDGVWEGQRLLPEGWVASAVTPQAEEDGWKFGYHWWLLPYVAYRGVSSGQGFAELDGAAPPRLALPSAYSKGSASRGGASPNLQQDYVRNIPRGKRDGSSSELAYTCLGYGGQRMFVLPKEKTVAVITAWNTPGNPSLSVEKALETIVEVVR